MLLVLAAEASAAPGLTFQSDPYPGIHRQTWVDPQIPARIRVLRIDLSSSEIAVYATKESDRGITTSEYASRVGAQVAINGDSFAVNGYIPRGLAMGDSNTWSQTSDDAASAVFHLRRAGERTVAQIIAPESIVTPADLPTGTEGVISGRPLLVRQSQAVGPFDCNDPVTMPCEYAPRTALGVSADGNRMWLVVVDGWQNGSLGMTLGDLASFMDNQLNVGMAMALDGGASSTLVLDSAVISSPSDGVERTVANHLGIKYGMLPKGELQGLICKHSVANCGTDVPSRKLANATVILDDGRTVVTDTTGFYSFAAITPRLACITVKKDGYLTVYTCDQIKPNMITFESVAMWEGTDPPDAGVGHDSGVPADASSALDAQTGDGGNDFEGPGGGCCDSGRDRPDVALLALVAFFWMRRRGTTA